MSQQSGINSDNAAPKGTTAVYPGSFDPFTKGHADVVDRALRLFGKVIVAIGYNIGKTPGKDIQQRVERIARLYASDGRVEVISYSTLTAELVKELGADVMVRGVRDVKDFEYERSLADANMAVAGVDTVLLAARPELGFLSSSLVRELQHYGKDVSRFLPEEES